MVIPGRIGVFVVLPRFSQAGELLRNPEFLVEHRLSGLLVSPVQDHLMSRKFSGSAIFEVWWEQVPDIFSHCPKNISTRSAILIHAAGC